MAERDGREALTIPDDLAAGSYYLAVAGARTNSLDQVAYAPITVAAEGQGGSGNGNGGGSGTGSGNLPRTGMDLPLMLGLVAVLGLLGGAAVFGARRLRPQTIQG